MRSFRLLIGAFATAGLVAAGTVPAAADAPSNAPSSVIGGSGSGAVTSSAAPLAAVPDRAEVKHKAWQQKRPSWCAPASVQLSLRTFGVKVTQDTLAEKMKTDSVGTSGTNMRKVYNSYLNKEGYQQTWVDGQDPEKLMDAVSYDVGVLRKAVPLGVWSNKASWIKTGDFGHVVSVRGYDKKAKTFTIWDPSANSYGGHHTVSVANLAKASQKNGLSYVTKL